MQDQRNIVLRIATHGDIVRLNALIRTSAIEITRGFYSPVQAEALAEHVFGVDTVLVDDRTYYLIEVGSEIAACGGWNKRDTLYGGDQAKSPRTRCLIPRHRRPGFQPSSLLRIPPAAASA
ncbi:hypothetical protein J5837_07715 [Pseudoxanthomonas helianthi]|uniref:Uncharacterized protein n=1 Tax=Pseudoxanthomonas helianthi TaxID=1453541 RepID=A0A941ATL3_9GAMM|nr:hypothetical protein [Pseudoxanthomonas helianthi]MBP3984314.1 hypothetical protein [Pseudoxanthomonas helianthi]